MHQRKTLWNNLQGVFGKTPERKAAIKEVLNQVAIDPSDWPESLTVEQFVTMANAFHTSTNLI